MPPGAFASATSTGRLSHTFCPSGSSPCDPQRHRTGLKARSGQSGAASTACAELRATRKPRLSLRFDGLLLLRFADRQFTGLFLQLPPRFTRFEPLDHVPSGIGSHRHETANSPRPPPWQMPRAPWLAAAADARR